MLKHNMKFLIVDDDPVILDLLTEILSGYGYEDLVTATGAEDALNILHKQDAPFDCLMLDIQMPGMDGIELCRTVRQMPDYAETPILMITAMSDKPYIDYAFAAGATDYTVKPFDVVELMSRVRNVERNNPHGRMGMFDPTGRGATPKTGYDYPVPVTGSVNGFIRMTVLENYARSIQKQRIFAMVAFAIHIPELKEVHESTTSARFAKVLTGIARAISETLLGTQAFMSYIGEGKFLCICDHTRLMEITALQSELAMVLSEDEYVPSGVAEGGLSVIVGPACVPKAFDRPKDLKFIERALDGLESREASHVNRPARSIAARLFQRFSFH
ncbi:Response regulator receiver domain protein [Sulfitobacter mediterraneus KCTC 32188]|nr:Response regulator receiver domain protein [Sulfitobacter mediterraneus KCTC 32188]